MDVHVSPALIIPGGELTWKFSRSSGPGGQHVNTTDTRVELSWDVALSHVLSAGQRERLLARLGERMIDGVLTVTASDHRSQHRNREVALARLAAIVRAGLAPPAARRRATRPTRGSVRRQAESKKRRSQTKQLRRRPPID